jgi:hypothetical protein
VQDQGKPANRNSALSRNPTEPNNGAGWIL